ncbi:hypothetical protein K2P56_05190 [Patescibacteria group bacterium]|nr:hypothetical protein [Patescibacteria group bacterium]
MRYFILTLLLVLIPHSANAATIRIVAPEAVNLGGQFAVEVFLDTEGKNINAIEGSVLLPKNVSVSEVRYRGSVVSLWLSPPAERTSGVIDFEGVVPGGYQASPERTGSGNLFTLILTANSEGIGRFAFNDAPKAYLNDGEGTSISLSKSSAEFSVVASDAPVTAGLGADTYAPEAFTPAVVSGAPYGLEGDVVVFATQDKDSGIRAYDIGFSYIGFLPEFLVSWVSAESPHQISTEVLGQYVFVRAIDSQGNVRIATLAPTEPGLTSFLLTWGLPVALLLFVGFLFFAIFTARRRVSLK